jgi:hypothetical protein
MCCIWLADGVPALRQLVVENHLETVRVIPDGVTLVAVIGAREIKPFRHVDPL